MKSASCRIFSGIVCGALLYSQPSFSEQPGASDKPSEDVDEILDEVTVDVQGSIEDADDRIGFLLDGDVRTSYLYVADEFSGLAGDESNLVRLRWRIGSSFRISEGLRFVSRVAGRCSTEECSPDFILQPDEPAVGSIQDGQITFDEFFLHWFRTDRFNIAIGRMETKFVTRGGVYSKSLERNDSNNLRVNWTDGIQATYRAKNGWVSTLIAQHNPKAGPSHVRRYPLDFESDRSRVSYHMAFENVEPKRLMIQRALTLSYLPSSLPKQSVNGMDRDTYVGIVGRLGHRWPRRDERWRIRTSLEVGYAPSTPANADLGIQAEGDTLGHAWAVTASLMDFIPSHSIGVNYARTEPGWLLSPQYPNNQELFEIRYMWRPSSRVTIDVRGRWRDELRETNLSVPFQDGFDFYARFTWGFTIKDYSGISQ